MQSEYGVARCVAPFADAVAAQVGTLSLYCNSHSQFVDVKGNTVFLGPY